MLVNRSAFSHTGKQIRSALPCCTMQLSRGFATPQFLYCTCTAIRSCCTVQQKPKGTPTGLGRVTGHQPELQSIFLSVQLPQHCGDPQILNIYEIINHFFKLLLTSASQLLELEAITERHPVTLCQSKGVLWNKWKPRPFPPAQNENPTQEHSCPEATQLTQRKGGYMAECRQCLSTWCAQLLQV